MKKILMILLSLPAFLTAQDLAHWQERAAEANLDLAARFETFQAKMLFAEQAGYLQDPQLNFGYFLRPITTRNGPQIARIGLRQQFPWFGTLKAQRMAEAQGAEAAYQNFLAARNQVFLEVAEVYYQLWALQEKEEILQSDRNQAQAFRSIALEKFAQGLGSLAEVLQIDNRLAALETKLLILKQDEKYLREELQVLCQSPPGDSLRFSELETLPLLPLAEADSLHPEWRALEAEKARKQAQKRISALTAYPQWGIGLDYILVDPLANTTADNNGADAWIPNLSISLPLYQRKYRKAEASLDRSVASLQLQQESLQDALRLRRSAAQLEHFKALERWRLFQKQSRNLAQSLRIVQSAYANDQASFQDWLQIEDDWLAAQENRIEAQSELWLAAEQWKYAGNRFPAPQTERKRQ